MELIIDNITITLKEGKCSNQKVLSILKPEARQFYQDGTVVFAAPNPKETKTLALCWRLSPDFTSVWITDEEGDGPPAIPLQMFAPKEFI